MSEVELVRGLYAAFAAGDVPKVIAALDPAIEWREAEGFPYADGNPYVGPEAVLHGVFAHLWRFAQGRVVDFQQYTDTGQVSAAMMPT